MKRYEHVKLVGFTDLMKSEENNWKRDKYLNHTGSIEFRPFYELNQDKFCALFICDDYLGGINTSPGDLEAVDDCLIFTTENSKYVWQITEE